MPTPNRRSFAPTYLGFCCSASCSTRSWGGGGRIQLRRSSWSPSLPKRASRDSGGIRAATSGVERSSRLTVATGGGGLAYRRARDAAFRHQQVRRVLVHVDALPAAAVAACAAHRVVEGCIAAAVGKVDLGALREQVFDDT